MKFLITGFEPFGGSPLNPSQQVVQAIDGQTINGAELLTAVLPVDGQCGPQLLLEKIKDIRPDGILCLGEANRRAALSIERVALNLLDYRIADNTGQTIIDEPVIPEGPAAYFSTAPVRQLHQALLAAGIPCELSLSAGTFLCNQVFYHALHHTAVQNLDIPVGFIHLPALPQQAASQSKPVPSMSLEISQAGVCKAVIVMAGYCQDE